MRSLAVVLVAGSLILAACGKPADPAAVEQAVTPCGTGLTTLGNLADMANAGAQDPNYAAQAQQVAMACRAARPRLAALKAPKACREVAEATEGAANALKAAFTGGNAGDPSAALAAADRAGVACTEALSR